MMPQAVQFLYMGVRNSSGIQELQLDCNSFASAEAIIMVRAAANRPSLVKFRMDLRKALNNYDTERVAQELPALQLKERCVCAPLQSPTRIQSNAASQARRAVLEGIQNNFHLCQLRVDLDLDEDIEFYLDLNRSGRLHLLLLDRSCGMTIACSIQ